MENRLPLGYIELESGLRPVYAFNDFFLNYTFDKKENWEALRLLVNAMLEAYAAECPGTELKPIKGEIVVTTQYKYYLKNPNAPKRQDVEIKELGTGNQTYVEAEGRKRTKTPVELRAVEYSVLGIARNTGKTSNQIWLMAESADKLMRGKTFANYLLRDEIDGAVYPGTSCIMFASLKRLSEKKTEAGELAAFLLGKTPDIVSGSVKPVADAMKRSCEGFVRDEGVRVSMSAREKWQEEAWLEGNEQGRQEGRQEAVAELAELIKAGLSPDEALERIRAAQT